MKKTSKRFFSQQEYNNLKYSHLSRKDYRKFIQKINERKAQQNVILDKEGFEFPYNLGLLHGIKRFKPNGVIVPYKKGKEFNRHTMGYVYSIVLSRINRRVIYTSKYDKTNKSVGTKEVLHLFYRFHAHRKNLKRKMAYYINNKLMDYNEQRYNK